MLSRLATNPEELNSVLAPLFAVTRDIATASNAGAIVETLRRQILGDTVDRISVVQVGFGASGEPVTEAVAVWDRDQVAPDVDLPEELRQRLSRQPLVISNVEVLDRAAEPIIDYARNVLQAASLAIFPLIGRDRTVGYLILAARKPHSYHEREVEALQALAAQAGVALENVSLLDAVSRTTERLNLVNELARALAEVRDPNTLGELVSGTLSKTLSLSHLSITLHEAGQSKLRAYTFLGDFLPLEIDLRETPIEQALTSGKTVWIDDVRQLLGASLWKASGAHALIVAPLPGQERRIGTLNVGVGTPGGFQPGDVGLCEQVAAQVGVSLENMRLFERLQLGLRDTTTLYRTSLAMSAARTPDEVFEAALSELAELGGADRIVLYLAGPDPREAVEYVEAVATWERGAFKTINPAERRAMGEAPVLSQFPGSDANLVFNDLEADSRLDSSLRVSLTLQGINALMLIPVSTGITWLGTLLLEAHQGQEFADAQARLCRNIADQMALIVASQRLLQQAEQLYHESRRRAEAAGVVSQLTAQLQRSSSVTSTMETAVRALHEALSEYDIALRLLPDAEDASRHLLLETQDDPPEASDSE
jgi:GAF domain-containing protein